MAEITKLAEVLRLEEGHPLRQMGEQWQTLNQSSLKIDLENFPGVIRWIRPPHAPITKVRYIIWRKPWMEVSRQTFIGSVLSHLGFSDYLVESEVPYPEVSMEELKNSQNLWLFSSEPYDFNQAKEIENIQSLQVPAAIVNGESFSWFGKRSLEFLQGLSRS